MGNCPSCGHPAFDSKHCTNCGYETKYTGKEKEPKDKPEFQATGGLTLLQRRFHQHFQGESNERN